jgi:tetratricopeptide (TPR) repeat protein
MFQLKSAAVVILTSALACACGRVSAQMEKADSDASPAGRPALQKHAASQKHIDELLRQLGDKNREISQRAQEELTELGYEAFEPLKAAARGKDETLAARAKYLLRLIPIDWISESDPEEVKNCLRQYENMREETRRDAMARLAKLPDAKGIAALCRLVRYESSVLSKQAAIALFFDGKNIHFPKQTTAAAIRADLQDCTRPAAAWIATWLRLAEKPKTAAADWAKLVENETLLLRKSPDDTNLQVVVDLIRFQATWLKQFDKKDESAAIRHLAELDYPKSDAHAAYDPLAHVILWLMDQKAWATIDAVAQRSRARFAADPTLLYLQAEAYAEQGKREQAEKTALQAFRVKPERDEPAETKAVRRFSLAALLRNSGQYAWARREFESLLAENDNQADGFVRLNLADMLHEQGQDLEAAAVLEKIVKAVEANKAPEDVLQFGDPRSFCAKRQYYLACHWKAKDNTAKQRECLEKALKFDPNDIDLLIECYQLQGQPPEFHKKIVDLVRNLTVQLHGALATSDVSAGDYNNYAWLIANTEGNQDEALRCSLKSLEMAPDEAGFLDTLAQVYCAKGDLREAVNIQTKALALEPRSFALKRHLEVFRKKFESGTK